MTKVRIFGEDITVKLLSFDGSSTYISDFDTIEVEGLTENRTYQAIGKNSPRQQSYGTGYKISLTREKRDNYLQSIISHNDMLLQKGLSPILFTLEYKANHKMTAKSIDPYYEFGSNPVDQLIIPTQSKQFSLNVNNVVNDLKGLGEQAARGLLSKNQALNSLVNNVEGQAKSAISFVQSVKAIVNTAAQRYIDIPKISLQDTEDYKQAMIIQKRLESNEPFKEAYNYINCTISKSSSKDKPRDASMEQIVLFASGREILSDKNAYDDEYMNDLINSTLIQFNKQEVNHILKNDDLKNSSKNKIKSAFEERLSEIVYDNNQVIL